MKARWIRPLKVLSVGVLGLMLLIGCKRAQAPGEVPENTATGRTSTSASVRNYQVRSPPLLGSSSDVPRFLDWAAGSHVDKREDLRKSMAAVADNSDIAQALIEEVERVQTTDPTRALLALALLGETRSIAAQTYLAEFVRRPLPAQGTLVEGEIIEQTRTAQLQAKAIDGLAHANNENSNKVVMDVIANHPSKIVRTEAINAYLRNHGDSTEARKMLSQHARKDELRRTEPLVQQSKGFRHHATYRTTLTDRWPIQFAC